MLVSPVITLWHFQDAVVVMNEPLLIKYYYVKSVVYLLLWLSGKGSTCKAGHMGSIPGSGRSPGEENGNTLQDSCLGNLRNRGVCQATVHGVTVWQATVHGSQSVTTERLSITQHILSTLIWFPILFLKLFLLLLFSFSFFPLLYHRQMLEVSRQLN